MATAAATMALAMAACSSADEPSASQPAAPTRDVQATIAALAAQPSFTLPTPTPAPEGLVDTVQEFSVSLLSVNQDWDRLRQEFDNWQAGLTSCDPAAVSQALGRFSSMFSDVSLGAKSMPRSAATRHLADKVIAAFEAEEEALRSFDGYGDESQGSSGGAGDSGSKAEADRTNSSNALDAVQDSGNPSMASMFDDVYQARAASARTLQEVSDTIADWEARSSESGRLELEEFAAAFHAANDRWDAFHQEYDAFRAEGASLSSGEAVRRLSNLITGFGEVVLATRALSKYSGAGYIPSLMAETAEAEDLALRVLRTSLQEPGSGAAIAPDLPIPPTTPGKPPPSPSSGESDFGAAPQAYEIFETELVAANASRRWALQNLEDLLATLEDEQLEALGEFSEEHAHAARAWDDFRVEFDTWRFGGSGCSVQEAAESLAMLNAGYGELSAKVGSLPGASVLRPLSELMVEAVAREAAAMQELRDGWRPFEPAVYVPYRQARAEADRMRRQASAGIADLVDRYDIDPS